MRTLLYISILCTCIACSPDREIESISDPILEKYPEIDYFMSRNWPDVSFNKQAFLNTAKKASITSNLRSEGTWVTQGPGNISGRVATIEIDNEGTIYLGYSKGGVFKSTDDGLSYSPLLDDQAYLAVSDIEVDPNDNEVIYIGTGDVDISIMFGIGNGVLKSVDGGESWTNMGLVDESIISRVHVDKNNSDLVFASAMGIPGEKSNNKGVYRSFNGGQNWEKILFVNDSTGIQDMLVHPDNPDIIYATGWNRIRNNRRSVIAGPDARIYRTQNGGVSWDTLTNDLPLGDFARVGLDMSGSDPDVIFANFGTGANFHSAYKSTDGGDSWTQIAARGENGLESNSHGGFAWFFGQMRVNPQNDDDIFILGVRLFRTLDGGQTWQNVNNGMHVDHHELVFDGSRIYVGNDGGAYRSEDLSTEWQDIDFNVTGLLYKVGYNPHLPEFYYGGAQDNSMYYGNTTDVNNWTGYSGGDGFQPAFHPTNSEIWYTESQNGGIRAFNYVTNQSFSLTSDLGGRFYWDAPYFVSLHDPNVVFLASDSVFSIKIDDVNFQISESERLSGQLTDPNSDWQAHSISTIHQSPVDPQILYAGTTDGLIWRTLDYGMNWDQIGEGVPRRFVSKIVGSPSDQQTVYVCHTGYRDNEYIPHIHRSDDAGITWVDISSNLPQFAINDVLVYPDTDDRVLFVATDGGVYFTVNAGESWERLGTNMPIIPIWDLEYHVEKNEVIAGSFARGILSFDVEQIDLSNETNTHDQVLNNVRLVPSITNSQINILGDTGLDAKYQIIDRDGNVFQESLIIPNQSIQVDDFAPGVYYIRIIQKSKYKTLAFTKM